MYLFLSVTYSVSLGIDRPLSIDCFIKEFISSGKAWKVARRTLRLTGNTASCQERYQVLNKYAAFLTMNSIDDPASPFRRLLRRLIYSGAVMSTTLGYRFSLHRRKAHGPFGQPSAPWRNAVLKTRDEWKAATEQVKQLGLPSHKTLEKNWDSLAMIACVLERMPRSARILDAGAELYSVLLPWLFLYGYKNLIGINLSFDRPLRHGPIRYEHGDITRTRFADGRIDALLCQSVLEHGVDIESFFRETGRILKPGGLVMVSVDYFVEPVATSHLRPGGFPHRVFTPDDIHDMIGIAERSGLYLCDPIDLTCQERAVRWDKYDLEYTFLMLTFEKTVST